MKIKSFNQYVDFCNNGLEEMDTYRKQLIAQCKQLYKYVKSATDFTTTDIDPEELSYTYLDDPEDGKYADWFDKLSNVEMDKAYDLYDRQFDSYKDIAEIVDILHEVNYLIKKAEEELSWVEGE